jgi:DNA-binding Lrp family transcriptional regulator
MNNKQHTRNFTPSDDALILQQPFSRIGVKLLATMLRTSEERVLRRVDELGVSLVISDDHAGLSTRERAVGAMDSSTRY